MDTYVYIYIYIERERERWISLSIYITGVFGCEVDVAHGLEVRPVFNSSI